MLLYTELESANLENANLENANLHNANLENANLNRVNLTGANLESVNLKNIILTDAKLENVSLIDVSLRGAKLINADFKNVNIQHAILHNANLKNVELIDVNLEDVYLIDANLTHANIIDSNFEHGILTGVNLTRATLTGVNLTGVNLTGAKLIEAYIDANLTNANLTGANLTGANVTNANLTGAILEGAILEGAIGLVIPQEEPPGIAFEVHNKSDKLIENPKFLSVIEPNEGSPPLEPFDYSKIENKFIQFINNENNFKGDDKEKLITTLQNVLNKSKRCGNPTGEISSIMNKAVEFAFRQNVRFTEAYIDIFIDETSKAYNTGTDNISCVKGIKERFYTSLLSAALQVGTIEDFPITPEIKILYCIASTGNTQKDPNEILQKWSELWEEKNAEEWKQMSKEEREEHLKQFMLDEYKKDICFEENKKINESNTSVFDLPGDTPED